MGNRLLPTAVTASLFVLAAAGPFAAPAMPSSEACSPKGSALSVTAFDSKFDKKCLAAPANEAFTIDFSNLDRGIPHNLAIYEDETAGRSFFKGELVNGPGRATYSVHGVPAGTFFFRCDPHPDMNGTFVAS